MPDKLLIFSRLFVDNDNCLQYSSRVLLLLVSRYALFAPLAAFAPHRQLDELNALTCMLLTRTGLHPSCQWGELGQTGEPAGVVS